MLTISISYLLWLFQKGLPVKDPWNLFLLYQIHSEFLHNQRAKLKLSNVYVKWMKSLPSEPWKGLKHWGIMIQLASCCSLRLLASLQQSHIWLRNEVQWLFLTRLLKIKKGYSKGRQRSKNYGQSQRRKLQNQVQPVLGDSLSNCLCTFITMAPSQDLNLPNQPSRSLTLELAVKMQNIWKEFHIKTLPNVNFCSEWICKWEEKMPDWRIFKKHSAHLFSTSDFQAVDDPT